MRNRVTVMLAAGAAMIASAVFVGPAAAVPATWTIDPGGPFTGAAGETVLEVQESGVQLSCVSAGATGEAKSGAGNSNPLATISDTAFNDCTGPFGLVFEVGHAGVWTLNGASYDAATGVTTGSIDNIVANITGPGCVAQVTGSVDATYTNSTAQLRVLPNFTLLIASVDPNENCFGLINTGEHASFDGAYVVSPAQNISMQP
jgi:hypothetical protein